MLNLKEREEIKNKIYGFNFLNIFNFSNYKSSYDEEVTLLSYLSKLLDFDNEIKNDYFLNEKKILNEFFYIYNYAKGNEKKINYYIKILNNYIEYHNIKNNNILQIENFIEKINELLLKIKNYQFELKKVYNEFFEYLDINNFEKKNKNNIIIINNNNIENIKENKNNENNKDNNNNENIKENNKNNENIKDNNNNENIKDNNKNNENNKDNNKNNNNNEILNEFNFLLKLNELINLINFEIQKNRWKIFFEINKNTIYLSHKNPPISTIEINFKDSNGNIKDTITQSVELTIFQKLLTMQIEENNNLSTLFQYLMPSPPKFKNLSTFVKYDLIFLAQVNPFTKYYFNHNYSNNQNFNNNNLIKLKDYLNKIKDIIEQKNIKNLFAIESTEKNEEYIIEGRKIFIDLTSNKNIDDIYNTFFSNDNSEIKEENEKRSEDLKEKKKKLLYQRRSRGGINFETKIDFNNIQENNIDNEIEEKKNHEIEEKRNHELDEKKSKIISKLVHKKNETLKKHSSKIIFGNRLKIPEDLNDITIGVLVKEKYVPCVGLVAISYDSFLYKISQVNHENKGKYIFFI
jgi:hypothetical protein